MKNIFNRSLIGALTSLLLAVVTPSTFAGAKEVFGDFDSIMFGDFDSMRGSLSKCERAGYYKVIVRNGWANQAFPLPIDGINHREIPSGATEVHEITQEGLNRIMEMMKGAYGTDINLVRANNQPESTYVMDGEGLSEEEKYIFGVEYCLEGRCDIRKYSPKNCNGYLLINIIDGHPYSKEEFVEKLKELKVDMSTDGTTITFSANVTDQQRTEL